MAPISVDGVGTEHDAGNETRSLTHTVCCVVHPQNRMLLISKARKLLGRKFDNDKKEIFIRTLTKKKNGLTRSSLYLSYANGSPRRSWISKLRLLSPLQYTSFAIILDKKIAFLLLLHFFSYSRSISKIFRNEKRQARTSKRNQSNTRKHCTRSKAPL